ncbi:hypothetical protein BDN70DRAFT_938782 [Pholiota conissans]|uniref:Secreted protein n=1 Tax=Pholiota conissans TaxID=109636 RepID=A0A9P6CT22_9AGAR|nr:hypothetical protein BDN70DRAFT_938782 [Pholiota conissans]
MSECTALRVAPRATLCAQWVLLCMWCTSRTRLRIPSPSLAQPSPNLSPSLLNPYAIPSPSLAHPLLIANPSPTHPLPIPCLSLVHPYPSLGSTLRQPYVNPTSQKRPHNPKT